MESSGSLRGRVITGAGKTWWADTSGPAPRPHWTPGTPRNGDTASALSRERKETK